MAMIIGGIGLDTANQGLLASVPKMLAITVPIGRRWRYSSPGLRAALTLVREESAGASVCRKRSLSSCRRRHVHVG